MSSVLTICLEQVQGSTCRGFLPTQESSEDVASIYLGVGAVIQREVIVHYSLDLLIYHVEWSTLCHLSSKCVHTSLFQSNHPSNVELRLGPV